MIKRRPAFDKSTLPHRPDLSIETALGRGGVVCGVDEAGRGPWAGPVTVAAVVLDTSRIPAGLHDSKQLSPRVRDQLFEQLAADHHVAIVHASVARIDATNIRAATLWAMRQAVAALAVVPDLALFDGADVPQGLPCTGQAVVMGDARSLSIAAASIIAKVSRDRLMTRLAAHSPGYGFDQHKGYGTEQHARALHLRGVTPWHRCSFRPIAARLEADLFAMDPGIAADPDRHPPVDPARPRSSLPSSA